MSAFLSETEWIERLKKGFGPSKALGFYSSLTDGYFNQVWGFVIPTEDHLVHRGDGIFEAVRIIDRAYFDLDAHLARLERSAAKVSLALPFAVAEIKNKCLELAKLCNTDQGLLRLYVSRGPGGYSTNPYDSVGAQLYLVMTAFKPAPARYYTEGASAALSEIPAKRDFEATIKSCNYLLNVLQKKEAVDHKVDFTLTRTEDGKIGEGSTESFYAIKDGRLIVPAPEYTLKGTTMAVTMELAQKLVEQDRLTSVAYGDLTLNDLADADEMAFVGTTLGVCPVTRWNGQPVQDGHIGKISAELGELLDKDMRSSAVRRSHF